MHASECLLSIKRILCVCACMCVMFLKRVVHHTGCFSLPFQCFMTLLLMPFHQLLFNFLSRGKVSELCRHS